MNQITEMIVTIATAIVGLAIVAVLVSKNAQTSQVIQSAGSAFGNSLAVAESPVTGTQVSVNLSYPDSLASSFGS
jgi:PRD1 phage membrane DNA delivery